MTKDLSATAIRRAAVSCGVIPVSAEMDRRGGAAWSNGELIYRI
ncbi:hypothetical protein [Streptomyces alkaliphilus]|nr:hypothetical protein [Streptomyces alkaliphilus]